MIQHKRTPRKLELGRKYVVFWNGKPKNICTFIKPTKHGYNFLNSDTFECVLNKHIYVSNKDKKSGYNNRFWINSNLKIEKYDGRTICTI